MQRVGSTPGPGAVSSAHRANCPGIPLGPFDVAGHAPFPKLPCLPNRAGFSRLFTFHTRPLASIAPARSCEAWRDTGRSLQCLHLDPSLSLPPFPTPLPNSSVPSWRPVPAAVPDRHPQGSEWPGAQGSGQRREGPASRTAAHAIWGFFMWSLRPASPQPKCPGDPCERGRTVYPRYC